MAVVSDNAIRTRSSYKTQGEAYINDTYNYALRVEEPQIVGSGA